MPIETRTRPKLASPGPYLARITNHLDPSHMGTVEVSLEKGTTSSPDIQSQTYPVQYLSPFYGVTSIEFEGADPKDFNNVQKSYGMWMIPPDVGTQVLVIFIDGDVNQGYWIGCVADKFQNHMVPGIAAATTAYVSAEQELKYGTTNLPVGEFHKRSSKTQLNPDSQKKPIHPFADKLMAQGLLKDDIRGVTTSSARREVPSAVFGISTPGPLDSAGKKGLVGYDTKATVPVSRLGGSQFVMDDGDQTGKSELVRLRTRTGHQILMHNTDDLIYIANSKGTAWIELTSDGKIDIFAEDSVSIHSKQDFNFRAERDINLEAVRNLNIRVGLPQADKLNLYPYPAGGNYSTNVHGDYKLIVGVEEDIGGNGDILFNEVYKHTVRKDILVMSKRGSLHVTTLGETDIGDINLTSVKGMTNIKSKKDNNFTTTEGSTNINSKKDNSFTTAASTNIKSAKNHLETATAIHMNGPGAATATLATAATPITKFPLPLTEFTLPNTDIVVGWKDKKFFKAKAPIKSIMKRAPVHEPWPAHENLDIAAVKPAKTDVTK